jgi:hypothetical protein
VPARYVVHNSDNPVTTQRRWANLNTLTKWTPARPKSSCHRLVDYRNELVAVAISFGERTAA